MQAVRRRDTDPEMRLRRLLHHSGLRYRVNARPLDDVRTTADLVFRAVKVAVFVDGCFWHGCSEHRSASKTNGEYWRAKIARNVQRDGASRAALERAGWLVLRFWEHDDPVDAAVVVRREVARRTSG